MGVDLWDYNNVWIILYASSVGLSSWIADFGLDFLSDESYFHLHNTSKYLTLTLQYFKTEHPTMECFGFPGWI